MLTDRRWHGCEATVKQRCKTDSRARRSMRGAKLADGKVSAEEQPPEANALLSSRYPLLRGGVSLDTPTRARLELYVCAESESRRAISEQEAALTDGDRKRFTAAGERRRQAWREMVRIKKADPALLTLIDALERVEACQSDYSETSNPLYAWEAFLQARCAGLRMPDWVVSYFEGSALALIGKTTLANTPSNVVKVPRIPARAVAEALGFKKPGKTGRWNPFREFGDSTQSSLALAVLRRRTDGWKFDLAYDDVAKERGVSSSTVARAWREQSRRWGRRHGPELAEMLAVKKLQTI